MPRLDKILERGRRRTIYRRAVISRVLLRLFHSLLPVGWNSRAGNLLVDRIERASHPEKGWTRLPPTGLGRVERRAVSPMGKLNGLFRARGLVAELARRSAGLGMRMTNEWQIVTLIALSATLIDAFSGDRHAGLRRRLSRVVRTALQGNLRDPEEFRNRSPRWSAPERSRIGHRTR